ncbi:VOC family protein [Actinopolymorpha alba]|uniref:VOC family protein n=1 Tax=Actinopolymorpha alba TaxID=533267 RepID=UPI00035D702E|nr:VOC family protein [Actinopolymorpha alba]
MKPPVKNHIGAIFVPVRDVVKAREWYTRLLGLPIGDELPHGHLYVVPMDGGSGLILDEMPRWGGDRPGGPPTYQTPAFMFDTDDVRAAYAHVRDYGAELVTEVEPGGWFTFRDPDGNLLMVCGADPEAPSAAGD